MWPELRIIIHIYLAFILHYLRLHNEIILREDEIVTQHWKSALAGAAVVIISATAGAGTASAHELSGMAKTAAAAPAARHGSCMPYLSVKKHGSGYEISYGGSSSGWATPGMLRITAELMVNGHREGTVSGTTKHGKSVHTRTGTHSVPTMGSVTVDVKAEGPGGSVSCTKTHM
jgi:hypothetical protein